MNIKYQRYAGPSSMLISIGEPGPVFQLSDRRCLPLLRGATDPGERLEHHHGEAPERYPSGQEAAHTRRPLRGPLGGTLGAYDPLEGGGQPCLSPTVK